MKKLLLIALAVIICSGVWGADKTKVFKQQTVTCVKTKDTIEIDGIMEKAWEKSNVYGMYVVQTTKKPLSPAEIRTMYDDENLYVFMKTKDKDITAYETRTDESTCADDVMEIFLRPGKNAPWYYNAEINALGTAYTAKNHSGNKDQIRWRHLWNPDLEYAIHIEGTLNNPYDTDKYWTLEVKIPFAQLDYLNGKTPKAGDVWTCNFAKYDYSIYLPLDIDGIELCSICHTDACWFHELVNYCPFVFGK